MSILEKDIHFSLLKNISTQFQNIITEVIFFKMPDS